MVGWTDVPPLFRLGDESEPTGFSYDLIQRVAEIAGFSVTMRRFHSMKAIAEAQIDGRSEIIPGIARLPELAATNRFSTPVATTRVRLFVRVEDASDPALARPVGRKIGTVPPALGSEPSPLLERNINVRLPSVGTALIKLLSGEIDGVLFPEEVMMGDAQAARLDHRIKAVGPPFMDVDRVIAVHESRADLLERVDAAIARLKASGELANIQSRWRFDMTPAPDVLTVGVNHFPPYSIVREDGSFTGYAVETLRALAERAGLSFQFKAISRAAFDLGPGPGRYDILVQAGISAERSARMDFALPIEAAPFSIFVRAGERGGIAGLDDLAGRRVGVDQVDLSRRLAEAAGDLDLSILDGEDALLRALADRRVDAILFPTRSLRQLIRREGLGQRIEEIAPPFFVSERAPALRFGLGEARERLNAVIPAYLVSERHDELFRTWFGERVYWTQDRVRMMILIGAGLILSLAVLLVISMLWRRRQVDRERRRFAAEIVRHLPVGVLLISPEGTIDFVNLQSEDQTPRRHPLFVKGQDFRAAVLRMIDEDWVDTEGLSKTEMAKIMTEDALADGHVREFRFNDGRIFRRTCKRLESGATLLVREDVTEYRRQLLQIEALNRSLEDKVREIDAANQELRAFAYATSHDLKAPSNTLMMTVAALAENLEGRLSPDDSRLIDVARRTIDAMRALIDDILVYTNTIGSAPECEPVDLNRVAAEVLEALGADIKVNAAEIRLGALPMLQASPTQMHQLVQNLISNAVKFHRPDQVPSVDVEAADAPPGYVAFKVRDNGIGIAPEHRKSVFQLFARLNRRSAFAGTGLGLAICQRIALNHGGRIELQSAPGEGACFTVLLATRADRLEDRADDRPTHAH